MALIDKASLLMVPSTYEAGTLYNVLPSGNRAPDSTDQNSGYDQTRADFTFDRGSNAAATRIGSDGLIKKYRENKLLQSNQFDTTWVNSNTTETGGQADKDGGTDAWLLTKSANGGHIKQSVSQSGVFTFSAYLKAGTLDWVLLLTTGGGNTYIDLANGVAGTQSGLIDFKIESVGSGWYRCSITDAASITEVRVYPADGNGVLSGTSGNILIQSAQLETGLVATDYLDSGATTAKAGVLIDLPRINYDANGENGSLLLEPSRLNKITNSEYINTTTFNFNSLVSISNNYAISPEGVQNAAKITADASSGYHQLRTSLATANGYDMVSCFVKASGYNYVQLASWADPNDYVNFDLTDGSIGSVGVNGPSVKDIEDYGNGWYRIHANVQASGGGLIGIGIVTSASAAWAESFTGNGTDGVLVWGVQLEASASYPSSYIPNHGESGGVTRAADSCSVTGVSDVIGQTEGTLFYDWVMNHESPNTSEDLYTLSLSDGTGNKLIVVNNYNNTLAVIIKNTTNQFYSNAYTGGADGARIKLALAYANNDVALYINGTQIATDSSATIPTLSQIRLNTFWNGNLPDSSSVKQLALFKERLTNAELAALTA